MRTTKRFTPAVLRRFALQERGTGTHETYRAWHQVSRGDPASFGRSHIQTWGCRQQDLLSDGERDGSFFAAMLTGVLDGRPQYPLSLDPARHELAAYSADFYGTEFPGTREIAKQLGIRHPSIQGDGEKADWVLTTDHLLTVSKARRPSLLALSFKPDDGWNTPRQRQLFSIECEYWRVRGVEWLLITPAQYVKAVALTLRRTAQWALGPIATEQDIHFALTTARKLALRPERLIIETIATLLGDLSRAQCALWQAIWSGRLPVDLNRGWRNHLPLCPLDPSAFLAQNPIASRRSAWI